MRRYLLPEGGTFYKANLHSHSILSDGNMTPDEIKSLYRQHGYSVVAYTDHDLLIPHNDLTDDSFLALSGFESQFIDFPVTATSKTAHICFIAPTEDTVIQPFWNEKYANIGNAPQHIGKVKFDSAKPPFERTFTPECINKAIKEAKDAGFFITYNHPAWSLEDYTDYTKYEGVHAMEIFNYDCSLAGYTPYAEREYDDMLRGGQRIYAVAADDNHSIHNACGGYVMIKAEKLEYETVMSALFAGDFYASNGPSIHELFIENERIRIRCSDAVMIAVSTDRRSAKAVMAEVGKTLCEASFPLDGNNDYFRITVRDKFGNCAFTRAYFTDEI